MFRKSLTHLASRPLQNRSGALQVFGNVIHCPCMLVSAGFSWYEGVVAYTLFIGGYQLI